MRYDYVIVGSGLFGAVFAYEAGLRKKRCLVLEKRDHAGGNIYTEKRDGIDIHRYGAHIFHTSDEEVWKYVNQFARFNSFINTPVANFNGKLYSMPFNMNTFYQMWGVTTPAEAKAIIEKQRRCVTGEIDNLEKDLPPEIIRRLPVRFTFDNNYFNDPYQGIPEDGYTAIIDKLLAGADVRLGADFNADREKYRSMADRVLYTGALDAYFDFRLGHLSYRSVRFEDERFECENLQGVAVMNYTDRETPYTRVIEHRHFNRKTVSPVTWISREYPVDYSVTGEAYYPVNDRANNELYARYRALAEGEKGLILGGRLAQYAYFDMDKTIRAALDLVRQELG